MMNKRIILVQHQGWPSNPRTPRHSTTREEPETAHVGTQKKKGEKSRETGL